MKNKKSEWQKQYELHKYPDCYMPCIPFYDVCNKFDNSLKCDLCSKQNDFKDYIE